MIQNQKFFAPEMTPFPKPLPQKISENGQKFRVPKNTIETELAIMFGGRGREKPVKGPQARLPYHFAVR